MVYIIIIAFGLYFLFSWPHIKKSYYLQSKIPELNKYRKESNHILSREVSHLKQDLEIKAIDSSKNEQEIEELNKSLEKAKSDCHRLQNDLSALQEENDRLSASLPPEGSIILSEERQREFYAAYHHFVSKSQEYQSFIDQFSKERESLVQQNNSLKKQISDLDDQKCAPYSMKDYTALNLENFKLRRRISDLEDELTGLKESSGKDDSKKQLDFLFKNYPSLADFLASEYNPQPVKTSASHDPVHDWISDEEYQSMSETDRNQLALDRYIESHKKSKWQLGRDYELSVGYQYEAKGFRVEYTGVIDGVADLGRDLIATKDAKIYIIQCKYWSSDSVIREKYIAQLFGTAEIYRKEHIGLEVIPLFVTSSKLSMEAKAFAEKLGVKYRENIPMMEFPRVKCNVGRNQFGDQTFIYHLPMDPQYDAVKTDKPRECRTFTVQEAESYGFRRAYS